MPPHLISLSGSHVSSHSPDISPLAQITECSAGSPRSPTARNEQSGFQRPKIPKRHAYSLQSSSPLAYPLSEWVQALITQRIASVRKPLPGCLCFVTPELSTTPTGCPMRCRLNPLSLINPPAVSRRLRSAGVGHRFDGLPPPLAGIGECKLRILPVPCKQTLLVSHDPLRIPQGALSASPNPARIGMESKRYKPQRSVVCRTSSITNIRLPQSQSGGCLMMSHPALRVNHVWVGSPST